MNSEEIRRLVKIVEDANITELEISKWGRKIKISKLSRNGEAMHLGQSLHYAVPTAPPLPAPPTPAAPAPEPSQPEAKGEELKAPMVGSFYRAPAPDADPYVRVGDTVQQGQVLCIIEAMKLMNEVEAEFACRILEILVENIQPVEYNQPLFIVEKL